MTISAVAGSRPPTRARWVGAPVATPHTEYGRSPGGRQQQHYVAVEVAGHQFHINDLVEIAHSRQSGASRRCQQQQKPKQAGEKQRRFAQVCFEVITYEFVSCLPVHNVEKSCHVDIRNSVNTLPIRKDYYSRRMA